MSAQTVTSAALSASPASSVAGQSVTLTATVTGSSPTGTVTFYDGGQAIGVKALVGSSAVLAKVFAGGSHTLTASYGGNSSNTSSTSAAVTLPVSTAAATMTFSATPAAASAGQNVTLMARVSGYQPTGTVTFSDGGTSLGTATLSGGSASMGITSLALGSHSMQAAYAGDASNSTASGTATVAISAKPPMTWQYGYDAMGRPNTVIDPNGLATYTYFDSLGRPIQTQQPANTGASTPTVTQMAYDLGDSLTGVSDPRNLTTSYTPNGLGNTITETSPDRGVLQYTFDAKGNVLTSTDARGKTTTFAWDNLDRLTSISYPTGTSTTFTYDGQPSPTPAEAGELTKMTDESGQTTWAHDAIGRLTTKTMTIGTKTFTVSYTWGDSGSALDKLTAITYPSGSRVNYSYDSAGMVSAITVNPVNPNGLGVSSTPVSLLSNVTYNADNNVAGWLWSGGTQRTIGYDSNGLISSYTLGDPNGIGAKAGLLRSISRDAAARIVGYTHTNNGVAQPAYDQTFAYDDLNRLVAANVAGTNTGYSYDSNGNRTSKTAGATTFTNAIASNSNRLTASQDAGGTSSVTYDAAGHMVADGTNTYTYSDRGRISSAATPGGTVNYLYSGVNQRISKSGPNSIVPTGVAFFVYDEPGQLLGEYDSAGTPVHETIYLGSVPVGVLKQTGSASSNDIAVGLYNVYADQIDTPRVITAQDHSVMWRWDSAEAFGATQPDQNPSSAGAFVFNQRFPGQVYDAETGLNQNVNREYAPREGRYRQADPIGLRGGINPYVYVDGDPLTRIDPSGLATKDPNKGSGPYHPPEDTSVGCTNADDCPEIKRKMYLLQKMITSHEGWDRANPRPKGGNRHADEIADLWRALGKCQMLWRKKDCDNCPPPPGFLDWVKKQLTPQQNQSYDPATDRWIPDQRGASPGGPMPGAARWFLLIP